MTWHNSEKLDKLDILIGLAMKDFVDEDTARWMSADVSGITFSENYYRRKRQVINRHIMKQRIAGARKVASKVAIVMLCILSAAFITVMSISALRNALWDAIVEWYDDYLAIRYEEPVQDAEDQSNGDNDVVVLPPTEILEYRKPWYISKGVEEELVIQTNLVYIINYVKGEELQYSFEQTILDDGYKRVNNENSTMYTTSINGYNANIIKNDNDEELTIMWEDGRYIYTIVSYIELEKTLEIAKSVG